MQWFRIPSEIYFEKNSIACLETMENVDKVFIITDKTMVDIGNIEKIIYCLNNRLRKCKIEIFSNVLPDPNTEIVFEGLKLVKNFAPDTIIAIGGGSVIDAAKAIWAFYENENLNFDDLRLNFMDIRKRICKYPVNHTIKLIAIPTTSGTGSEVTSFSVITDKNKNVKYPLADYYLTPTVSIIDPQFTVNLPKIPTADTGMDVLTHAIEAYVSTMASDFTDALAISAFKLVFKYIRRAYKNGKNDFESREKMHNASCMAGMAFTNAFLGLNHSMAHKLGAEFHISHGRANAIILPYVIKYNSSISEKFVSFPKYSEFVADKKYIELAKSIGIFGNSDKDILNKFINEIFNLNKDLDIPYCLKDCGISENEFLEKIDYISELAYKDQCTGTNPKSPMISEIRQLYLNCYYGEL